MRSRKVSAEEITRTALSNIEDANPRLNAFLEIRSEGAPAAARAVDTSLPLAGVPIAIKDNM